MANRKIVKSGGTSHAGPLDIGAAILAELPSPSGAYVKQTHGLTAIGAVGGLYAQAFITHSLGTTPTDVSATSEDGEQYATVQNRTSTQFLCTSKKTNGAVNAGVNIHWEARA